MECPKCNGTGQIVATMGMRLKAHRKARGVNIEEVEKAIGIKQTTLSALENDTTSNPGLKNVVALAGYYNTTVDALISEDC